MGSTDGEISLELNRFRCQIINVTFDFGPKKGPANDSNHRKIEEDEREPPRLKVIWQRSEENETIAYDSRTALSNGTRRLHGCFHEGV